MNPFRPWGWGILLGIGGLAGLGTLAVHLPAREAPDVGRLDPVVVAPAEEAEVHHLGPGQTLGEILATSAGFGQAEQQAFLLAFREQASPRRMRVGAEIVLKRRSGVIRGVDVGINPDTVVRVLRSHDGWSSSAMETPIWTDTLYLAGHIETVLWNAVVGHPDIADVPARDRALLLHYLDQVFQWQIDFSRQIQTGDYFRLAFERDVRPDGSMRGGRIVAAELVNQGRSLHAIWFDVDGNGRGGYYDREGKSVRRAFLTKPLEFRRISSRFTRARFHPVLQTWRAHVGVDYAADPGTPVLTTADGVVTQRGWSGGYGNLVEVRHASGFTTRYAHLRGFAAVRVGSRVGQGEVIGYVGSTGLATGPHLHYELRRNGSPVDPLSVNLPAGEPIPDSLRERWSEESNVRLALLDRMRQPTSVRFAQAFRAADEVEPEP